MAASSRTPPGPAPSLVVTNIPRTMPMRYKSTRGQRENIGKKHTLTAHLKDYGGKSAFLRVKMVNFYNEDRSQDLEQPPPGQPLEMERGVDQNFTKSFEVSIALHGGGAKANHNDPHERNPLADHQVKLRFYAIDAQDIVVADFESHLVGNGSNRYFAPLVLEMLENEQRAAGEFMVLYNKNGGFVREPKDIKTSIIFEVGENNIWEDMETIHDFKLKSKTAIVKVPDLGKKSRKVRVCLLRRRFGEEDRSKPVRFLYLGNTGRCSADCSSTCGGDDSMQHSETSSVSGYPTIQEQSCSPSSSVGQESLNAKSLTVMLLIAHELLGPLSIRDVRCLATTGSPYPWKLPLAYRRSKSTTSKSTMKTCFSK